MRLLHVEHSRWNAVLFDNDPFKLGYAMGLIVGEGSFTHQRGRPVMSLKLHVRDPFPFQFLRHVFGGRVYGPYSHDRPDYYLYVLAGWELQDAIRLFDRYLPSSYRREQYERWRATYFSHLPVPDTGHVTFPGLDE
jgi:hypothetical protein